MDTKINYTLVGLFVLILGAGVVTTGVWLGSRGAEKSYATYEVHVNESVAGLNPRAPVKYRGVDVGQVRSIELANDNPEQVKVLLNIETGTPIKTDTEAVLSRQGLTGIAYVDLAGGTQGSPVLTKRPGERYPVIPAGQSLMLRIDTAVSATQAELFEVTNEVKTVLRNLNAFLVKENQDAISDSLKNVQLLTESFVDESRLIEENLNKMSTVIDHLNEASRGFPDLVRETNKQLPELVQTTKSSLNSVKGAADSISQAANRFDRLVGDANGELARFSSTTLAQTSPLVVELNQLSASMRRLADSLARDPNQIIVGKPQRPPGPGE